MDNQDINEIKIEDIIPCYNIYKDHGGSLDAQEYGKVSYKAMHYIGYVTLKRAFPFVNEDENILYCHAELCDQFATINALTARINAAKEITSETVGPHTVRYASAADSLQSAKDALYPIVWRYLAKYMYRGIPIV